MNKLILFLSAILFVACGTTTSQEQKESSEEQEHGSAASTLQLNNGAKWKADSTTRTNVAILVQLVNDSNYRDGKSKEKFSDQLQNGLDSLVTQCKMSGPDHDALHTWLKPVLHNAKALKEDGGEYNKKYTELRRDLQSFYDYFD